MLSIGIPGSGKSTWFKRHNILPLSSDMVRILLFDDVTEQRYQDLVFSTLRSMLRARLLARRPSNYLDATNLSPHERRSWIKLAHDFGYEAHAVFFDVPPEVCMERNRRRERNVPEDVMRRMASKLRPPKFEEGFAKITVVRLKKKEGERPARGAAARSSPSSQTKASRRRGCGLRVLGWNLRRDPCVHAIKRVHALHDLVVGQHAVGFLGALVDAIDQILIHGNRRGAPARTAHWTCRSSGRPR